MKFRVTYHAIKQNSFSDWFYDTITAKDLPSAFSKTLGIAKTLEILDSESGISRKFIVDSISQVKNNES
jgi:hypothetical protein